MLLQKKKKEEEGRKKKEMKKLKMRYLDLSEKGGEKVKTPLLLLL